MGKQLRFPRLGQSVEEKLAALDARAFQWLARGHKANIEAGRVFLEIKHTLKCSAGHGHWERHFAVRFAPMGVSLRTAQEWMAMAKKAKSAESAFFPAADDPQAQDVNDATEKAAAADRRQEKLWLDKMFKQLTSELLALPSWPDAPLEIIEHFRQIRVKFGISSADVLENKNTEAKNENVAA